MKTFTHTVLLVFSAIVVLTGINTIAMSSSSKYRKNTYDVYLSRIVQANFRVPYRVLSSVSINSRGETNEDVLIDLIKDRKIWNSFSYEQKRQFVFVVLLYGNTGGGVMIQLSKLAGKDGVKLYNDLNNISPEVLISRFNLSQDGVKAFKSGLRHIRGY